MPDHNCFRAALGGHLGQAALQDILPLPEREPEGASGGGLRLCPPAVAVSRSAGAHPLQAPAGAVGGVRHGPRAAPVPHGPELRDRDRLRVPVHARPGHVRRRAGPLGAQQRPLGRAKGRLAIQEEPHGGAASGGRGESSPLARGPGGARRLCRAGMLRQVGGRGAGRRRGGEAAGIRHGAGDADRHAGGGQRAGSGGLSMAGDRGPLLQRRRGGSRWQRRGGGRGPRHGRLPVRMHTGGLQGVPPAMPC
mmetsp:Transcript_25033/g.70553  ORF Transcript_25033/g.70553 Transcript_25033/m.70553 type:complete len:250 (-) Transcript_25033:416-1165(-)